MERQRLPPRRRRRSGRRVIEQSNGAVCSRGYSRSERSVHTLRMIQTITRTTIMVPSNPKPSISFLLLKTQSRATSVAFAFELANFWPSHREPRSRGARIDADGQAITICGQVTGHGHKDSLRSGFFQVQRSGFVKVELTRRTYFASWRFDVHEFGDADALIYFL